MKSPSALRSLLRDPRLWRGHERAALRAAPTGHAALDDVLPGGGWPLGAVSEILHARPGVGELSLALPLLARLSAAGRPVVFITPPCLPYAPALAGGGVALSRMLVVETSDPTEALWSGEQLLRARAGAVLMWCRRLDSAALRRLQLAAEDGDGLALLYRPLAAARESSVAALRLQVDRRQADIEVDVLRCRGARPSGRLCLDAVVH